MARGLRVGCCEDDPAIRRLLEESFSRAGHRTVFTRTGAEAMSVFTGDAGLDVVVLDVGLPDVNGRDLCRALRANGQHAPVMFLSGIGEVHEIVQGFAAGGLDYLLKPFAVLELIARVEALGRRSTPPPDPTGLRVDPAQLALVAENRSRSLTPTEFRIAAELLAHAGQLVHRATLIDSGWVPGARVQQNTLDSYLHRLRTHLAHLGSPASIKTVRGVGYILTTNT